MAAAVNPELLERLRQTGMLPDDKLDLAHAALTFSELTHPGISIARYASHIRRLGEDTGQRHRDLLAAGSDDNLGTRLAALKHVLADQHGYQGDEDTYDDLRNADLIDVIERRKGMPITLSILYILAAQAQGWDVAGLNVPGHFLVRLDREGQRLIFDPFNRCAIMNAPELRQLLKKTMGPEAELSSTYYEPVTSRQILIRLQNNIKIRLIEGEDYEGALRAVDVMRAIDPKEYRLLLDEGVLCARTGRAANAINALEEYIKLAPDDRDRHDASMLLQHIRGTVN